VLNAGLSFGVKPWLETTVEEVDRLHSVNVRGSFATAKAAVKSMIASPSGGKGCSIVFVSSVAATYGEVGMA
jgi:NAD(P)-dependent dehydrogenase (short-subunit alcohol dehydrogenase family)